MPKTAKTHSRRVHLCDGVPKGDGFRTGAVKLWAFGYPTLAKLFDLPTNTVRKLVRDGELDPSSLQSVLDYYNARQALKEAGFRSASVKESAP